jgi:hypothetical protein
MRVRFMGLLHRFAAVVVVVVVAAAVAVLVIRFIPRAPDPTSAGVGIVAVPEAPRGPVTPTSAQFSYGFDLAQAGPYNSGGAFAGAVSSARHVLSAIPGMLEDTSIMDWGLASPEPIPGIYHLGGLAARINLITSTGGTPVITLCAAPDWMKNGTGPNVPPTPAHYGDFAALAAKIAQSFPQVKYFVVWNELKGFWNSVSNTYAIGMYTNLYNQVYTAIKQVRPDALVGGPYAPTTPYPKPQPHTNAATPHGAWGYLDQRILNAIQYWIAHKAGADFIAVDGPDLPPTGPITDPLTATQKYAVVDQWLRERTSLPIWWIESHIQPGDSGWSASQAAAIRIAALLEQASSGARVGLQWQPQQNGGVADEGLWTTTYSPSGGTPTPLARLLPEVLAVLRDPVALASGQGSGILVAKGRGGTIALNTTTGQATARVDGAPMTLAAGQVKVKLSPT